MGSTGCVAVLLAGVLAGCGPTVSRKVISAADLQEPSRTRLTASMTSSMRDGTGTEETPTSIPREAVLDEAVIKRLTPAEVCFDLLVRTPISMDVPLTSWRVKVDEAPAQLAGELVTVRDYPCTGEAPTVIASNVTQGAFERMRVGEPKEIAFRVVERRATGCFARNGGGAGRVRLALTLPANDGKNDWRLSFEWRLLGN